MSQRGRKLKPWVERRVCRKDLKVEWFEAQKTGKVHYEVPPTHTLTFGKALVKDVVGIAKSTGNNRELQRITGYRMTENNRKSRGITKNNTGITETIRNNRRMKPVQQK